MRSLTNLPRMAKRVNWRSASLALAALLLISAYARCQGYGEDTNPFLFGLRFNSTVHNNRLSHSKPRPTNVQIRHSLSGPLSRSTGGALNKADEMKQRTANMRLACSQYPVRRQLKVSLTGRLFYISEQYNLSYCRVAKVGSTFWTQVFMTLAGVKSPSESKSSMFDVPRDETHEEMKKHSGLTMDFHDKRVHETKSFLVSRNPYSRLFSCYIDRIYLPNKWKQAAKMVEEKKRQQCGIDVTFEEFLSSITTSVMTKGIMDLHWAPIFSICLPCEANVDILAKQETFNDDAKYILDEAGVDQSIRDEVQRAVGESLYETAIPTLVHTYVDHGHSMNAGCISESGLAERIWSAFQIQGYIHNEIRFPSASFRDVSADELEAILTKKALEGMKEHRMTSEERDVQKHAWKVSFWKSVTLETLQRVQDSYYEDFFVFQYDLDPRTM